MPNIVEVYTEHNKQNIILISGFSGSGKSKIGVFISKLFKIKLTYLSDFYHSEKKYDKPQNYYDKLSDGTYELDWDNIYNSVDWITFNEHVDNYKHKGIVIVGFGFPKLLIKFKQDFHIHVKINKNNLFINRDKYIKSHPDAYAHKHTPEQEKLIFNKITFNHYIRILKDSDVTLRLNANENTIEEMYDKLFSYMMNFIKNWLSEHLHKVVENRPYNTDNPYDGYNNTYYNGISKVYEDFYYDNKRKYPYGFNNIGQDYSNEHLEKQRVSISPDDTSSCLSNTSDSGADYLFTAR